MGERRGTRRRTLGGVTESWVRVEGNGGCEWDQALNECGSAIAIPLDGSSEEQRVRRMRDERLGEGTSSPLVDLLPLQCLLSSVADSPLACPNSFRFRSALLPPSSLRPPSPRTHLD